MDRRLSLVARAALVGIALGLPMGAVQAQDPAIVNADSIHVTLDNEKVRVFEATLKPGDKENVHSHPTTVMYILEGGKIRNHIIGGDTFETELKAGQTMYRGPITHWAENIGTTTIRLIVVEMKGQ